MLRLGGFAGDDVGGPGSPLLRARQGPGRPGREIAQSWDFYKCKATVCGALSCRYCPEISDDQTRASRQFEPRSSFSVGRAGAIRVLTRSLSSACCDQVSTLTRADLRLAFAGGGLPGATRHPGDGPRRCRKDPDLENPRYPAALADMTAEDFRRLGDAVSFRYPALPVSTGAALHRQDAEQLPPRRPYPPHAAERHDHRRARREPMACCFSNLKQLLLPRPGILLQRRGHRPATEWTYLDLMEHWDAALPAGGRCAYSTKTWSRTWSGNVRRMLDHCSPPLRARVPRIPRDPPQRAHAQFPNRCVGWIFRDGLEQWKPYEPWLVALAVGPRGDAPTRYRR